GALIRNTSAHNPQLRSHLARPQLPSSVEARRAVPCRFLPAEAASSPTACLAAPTASASTPARASSAKHCCKDETRTSKMEIRQATELRFSSFVFRASFLASFSTEESAFY